MSGSSTLRSADVRGIRLKLWKTKPILRLRTYASSNSSSRLTSMPSSRYRPVVGHVEAADDVHQRRLAAAGRAHDRDEVAPLDAQVDAAQRVDGDVARAVGLRDALEHERRAPRMAHPPNPPEPMRTPPKPPAANVALFDVLLVLLEPTRRG